MRKILLALALLCFSVPSFAADKPLVIESGKIKQLPASTTLQINASGTAAASINIPHGAAPTSPTNGDCWTTSSGLFCRINGVTVGPYGTGGGGGGGTFRGVLAKKSADSTGLNLTAGTNLIAWDAETYDTDSIHDNVTNNTRLTVPSGVSKIKLIGQIRITSLTAGNWVRIWTIKNGGSELYDGSPSSFSSTGSTSQFLNFSSPVLDVSAGDYFEMSVQVQSDTSVNLLGSTGSWFAMEILQ